MERAIPSILGGFELIERVATGGMASLYLARRAGARGFVKPVAVKVVHAHLAEDPEFVEMFVDEAHICSRLSHPNIVHVEELGEENGFLYLVMEFVEGCPLRAVLNQTRHRKSPLPLPLAVHVAASAADGLHYAHEARGDGDEPLSIVHRDVSPTNLLLSKSGHIKLIDFGIAKSADQQHQTTTRKLKGKLAYMSPEQVRYDGMDRRSDIYSLGVVLWEVLANRRAFRARDEVALVHEVTTKPLIPIESIRDDLPDGLIAALKCATQRQPVARFETALEFRQALVDAVPDARQVQDADIAALVRRVLSLKGDAVSPHRRVRSVLSDSASDSGAQTPSGMLAQPSAQPEVARTMMTPPPGPATARASGERRLMVAVVVAALVFAVLSVAAFLPLPGPEKAPLVRAMEEPSSVEAKPDLLEKADSEGKSSLDTVSETGAGDPSEPVEGSASDASARSVAAPAEPAPNGEAPVSTAGSSAAAPETQIAGEEIPEEPPADGALTKKGDAKARAVASKPRTSSRRGAAPRKRAARPRPRPSNEPSTSAPGPSESEALTVDGVRLATPDEVDRASLRGRKDGARAVPVEQDGATLADEYQ